MDKNKILLNFKEEDRLDVSYLYEKCILAKEKDITIFGNSFYPPNIWTYFKNNFETKDFKVECFGCFEQAERRMVCFNNLYQMQFPFVLLQIKSKSKFNTLSHRDYLGSILSVGIKRNKIGDLLVKGQSCFVPVSEDIKDFILSNLSMIGGVPCTICEITNEIEIPIAEFEDIVILVQSLRLDSIVSKLANVSRSKSQSLIEQGKVLLDYNKIDSKSQEIVPGQRITIRGIGKFVAGETIGQSKSGKSKIIIKKYT